jgi:hypothetical protein
MSCFGAREPHHRPDPLLSPLFIQMTCRFFADFFAVVRRFPVSSLLPNALRGGQKPHQR